jgi:release factor glutamine methyltransferase
VVSLLELAKERSNQDQPICVADIGTGSGILAVCAAVHLPASRIWAVDISDTALAVARKNAEKHNVSDRIEFFQGDLFQPLSSAPQFDFIVSNPPYVAESERDLISREVREHEPSIAVFSGPDGCEMTRRLIGESAEHLRAGGWLIFEISPDQEQTLRSLIDSFSHFESPLVVKDLAGMPRVMRVRRTIAHT